MQDPTQEIARVVKGLVEAKTATIQRDVLEKHFAPDASFDHPLCSVVSSTNVSVDLRKKSTYHFLSLFIDIV